MTIRHYGPELTRNFSTDDISVMLELVQNFMDCTTPGELKSVLDCLPQVLPVEYYVCLFSQNCEGNRCESYHLVTTNFPDEWVRLYAHKEYHRTDPVMLECNDHNGLMYWADIYEKNPPEAEFLSNAADFGLVNGYASSIRNLAGSRCGIVSVSGRELVKTERNSFALEIVMPHVYQAMDRISYKQKMEGTPSVSPREKEVLKWIAQGKTTWETSVILGMSERTVKYHVSNIMRKLNATSRAHAAAIALEHCLVEID